MTANANLIEVFAANCIRNGMRIHHGEPPAIPGAAISQARYALADPGSVVVFAGPDEPRARSLLPDVHIAVVETDDILPDLPALLRLVRGALPSSLAIISGPSRSADIEMTLAIGVHGPCEQHVVIRSSRPT